MIHKDTNIIKYINLEHNLQRKHLITSLLKKFPYRFVRTPGVMYNPEDVSYEKYLKVGIDPYLKKCDHINGIIGCWIAHSHALEDVGEREGITIVLEDDFVCVDNFFAVATEMINVFDKDFDVIIFDPWGLGPLNKHKICDQVYKAKDCNYPYYAGTQCLFVNNKSIPKILQIKSTSFLKDYDGFLIDNAQINCFMFYTGLSTVRKLKSDIRGYDTK